MSQRPNVFNQKKQNIEPESSNQIKEHLHNEANAVYDQMINEYGWDSIKQMKERTEQQIRERDANLRNNKNKTDEYNNKLETLLTQNKKETEPINIPIKPEIKMDNKENTIDVDISKKIEALSMPQLNIPHDVIPLPSEGKLYKNVNPSIRIAFMSALDEDILTSPNILKNADFLEIIVNRKLLEPNLRYKDLHVGDRNAILLWLRSTSYGHNYPVTLYDENDDPFEYNVDLSTFKYKKLGAIPDDNGYFDYILPLSKDRIKFKFLSIGDIEYIQELIERDDRNGELISKVGTYSLKRQIISINGINNANEISTYVDNMRIGDSSALRDYMESIESGVDLRINVRTPGGSSIDTFLPINVKFFWPNSRI